VRHVTDVEMSLFVSGRLAAEEQRRIVRHLLARCPGCLAKAAPYAAMLAGEEREPGLPGLDEAIYEPVLARVFAAVLRRAGRHETEELCRDWVLTEVRQQGLNGFDEVADGMDWEIPGRARVEALLTLSFEARYRDPEAMRLFAAGAMVAAANLGKARSAVQDQYVQGEIADLQARAWGELANALRVCEATADAESALAEANRRRAAGTGDPLIRARLLDIQASLRTDQRRLEEASALLDEVFEIYQEAGETHLAGRALVSQGISLHYDDRPGEAVGVLRQGLSMLDGQKDPQLVATGQKGLLDAMAANGDFGAAKQILLGGDLHAAFAGEPLNLLKVAWLEGRILAGLGEAQDAEQTLSRVEDGFLQAGLEYEAALTSLERTGVLLQLGRVTEAEELAEEALETFRAMDVVREALRAVLYLRDAWRQRTVTAGVVRDVVRFLERLQRKPYLRFLPP